MVVKCCQKKSCLQKKGRKRPQSWIKVHSVKRKFSRDLFESWSRIFPEVSYFTIFARNEQVTVPNNLFSPKAESSAEFVMVAR